MSNNRFEVTQRLTALGISYVDACALRRIAMTLHRWHELECGDGNDYYSWAIVRGQKTGDTFAHNDNGKPYIKRHEHRSSRPDGKLRCYWSPIADRETGALKRLRAIMTKYAPLAYYVQSDPRGASLYILRPDDVPAGCDIDAYYSRGVAVYK